MTQHLSSLPLTPPRRYLSLCLPWLPAERAIRRGLAQADAPFVLIEQQRGALRIAALGRQAARQGLERGLPLADARARVPQLAALPFAPRQDAALTARLALLCGDYTPSVAIDPPPSPAAAPIVHGLVLDITGCAHLHGGEQALAQTLVQRLAKAGITARTALADTPQAARALARFGPAEVNALPLAALADDDAQQALRRAGFRNLGDLARVPRAALAARFGGELVRRLSHLLAEQDPHIAPHPLPQPITLSQRFAEPIAHTSQVLAAIERLLLRAAAHLAERSLGGRAFALSLFRSDGHIARLAVETSTPSRDPALVMRLFRERIDSLADPLDPGFGYDAIDLAVPRTEPLGAQQKLLSGEGLEVGPRPPAQSLRPRSEEPTITHLLDRLTIRYGANAVLRFSGADSHIPERAGTLRPQQSAAPLQTLAPTAGEPPRRPLLLFDPPQRVEVIAALPDGPPRRFAWRGRSYGALRYEGPERIAPEWWRQQGGHTNPGITRDYYQVEDASGHRFWLFRNGLYETLPPSRLREGPGVGSGHGLTLVSSPVEEKNSPLARPPSGRREERTPSIPGAPKSAGPAWYIHGVFA